MFRNWKAAESYYANSLREARFFFERHRDVDLDVDDEEEPETAALVVEPDQRETLAEPCPACKVSIEFAVPTKREVAFVTICKGCRTHVQFSGSAAEHKMADLGTHNDQFACPQCGSSSRIWISPEREVRFLARCEACDAAVSIQGRHGSFTASRLQA